MKLLVCLTVYVIFFMANTLLATDVYRFRGEESQGKYNETGLMKSWPEEGLTPKWINEEVGGGWSSVSKVGNRLFINGTDANDKLKESILCLDLNGKKVWQTPVGATWKGSYPESRATPTFVPGKTSDEDRIVIYSGGGEIYCLDANDGKVLWNKDITGKYDSKLGFWGIAESVNVKDGTIYLVAGGKKALAIALKLEDGSVVWESPSNNDNTAYVTPVFYENQMIIMTASKVNGVDIKTGKMLWEDNYREKAGRVRFGGINCNVPLVRGNQFFVSAGYDQGGVMYEILPNNKGVKVVWCSKVLDPHHGGMVEVNGRIYGSNWINNGTGNWVCLDWETGETIYEEPWEKLGKGSIIYADGKFFIYEEKRGTIALANLTDKFDVISSFRINFGTKEHWAHPVISDGILYVRHGKALAAFDIRSK